MTLIEQILFSLLILFVGLVSLYLLQRCARQIGLFGHITQLLLTILAVVVFILFVYVAFGNSAMMSVVTGLSIGFGLALQPLIKVIVNGFIFDGTRIARTGKTIEVDGIKGKVNTIGMLHTWIEDKDGNLHMINNSVLNEKPLKLYLY